MDQKTSPDKSCTEESNLPQTGSSDEKAPDSSENCLQKNKGGWPKGKKRGYVRYMNERRDDIRTKNPGVGFTEITRILAEEWGALPTGQKKQYLDAADEDRERYAREIDEYKQTTENNKNSTIIDIGSTGSTSTTILQTIQKTAPMATPILKIDKDKIADFSAEFDIPIFTEEFLEHNKVREAELRQLRKSNIDYEQQNAILHKHIENMRTAIDKLENETIIQKSSNGALQTHLEKLRGVLVQGFQTVSLPGGMEGASTQNIDSYMTQLHTLVTSGGSHGITAKARDIVSRLDLPMH